MKNPRNVALVLFLVGCFALGMNSFRVQAAPQPSQAYTYYFLPGDFLVFDQIRTRNGTIDFNSRNVIHFCQIDVLPNGNVTFNATYYISVIQDNICAFPTDSTFNQSLQMTLAGPAFLNSNAPIVTDRKRVV